MGFNSKIQRRNGSMSVARNFYPNGIKLITMDYSMLIVAVGYPVSIIFAYLVAVRMFAGKREDE
jgi:hypothetical protein